MLAAEFPEFPDPDSNTALGVLETLVKRNIFAAEEREGQVYYSLGDNGEHHITFYCNLFWPFLESYMVGCLTLLSIRPNLEVGRTSLHQRMGWLAERMFEEGRLCFEESCAMDTLDNSISIFSRMNIIRKFTKVETDPKNKNKKISTDMVQLAGEYQEGSKLFELVQTIDSFRKPPLPASSGPKGGIQRELTDYPILSKL